MTDVTSDVTTVTTAKWQTINTHTLRCCLRLWLQNNIKSGPYGFAVCYSTD